MSKPSPFEKLTREQLIAQLEQEVWASALPHIARNLAEQVMTQLAINPQGVDLVMWAADARHHSNLSALTEWLGRQMEDPFFQKSTQSAPLQVITRQVIRMTEAAEAANS